MIFVRGSYSTGEARLINKPPRRTLNRCGRRTSEARRSARRGGQSQNETGNLIVISATYYVPVNWSTVHILLGALHL